MDPVTALGIVGTATQLAQMALQPLFSYYKSAKGARREMLQLQLSLQALRSSVDYLAQFEGLDASAEVLRSVIFHPLDATSGQTLVDALRNDMSKIERKLRHVGELKQRFLWPFRAGEVADIVKQIDRYQGLISLAVEMDDMTVLKHVKAVVQDIKEGVQTIREDLMEGVADIIGGVTDIKKELDVMSRSQRNVAHAQSAFINDEERRRLLRWIDPEAHDTFHRAVSRMRYDGAALNPELVRKFEAWRVLQSDERGMWCSGRAGTGKTYFSSFVIDTLRQDPSTLVAYVYFRFDRPERNTVERALCCLLKQLIAQSSLITPDLLSVYREQMYGEPAREDLQEHLLYLCRARRGIFLVFDAPDECGQDVRDDLYDFFCLLREHGARVFATGRSDVALAHRQDWICALIKAEISQVVVYVRSRLLDNRTVCERVTKVMDIDTFSNEVARASDGMFLFASLYLGGIFRCKSVRTVRQELEFLNSTSTYPLGVTDHLEPLYSRMMQAVRSQLGHDRDHALTAILWLSHHSGDMDARFLSLVVSVPPLREDARELEEFDILDHDEILDCCCGLVNANGFGQYRLVHETFRDYLRRNPIVPRDEAGISMTKASLSCLCRSRYFVPHVNLRDLDPALHLLTTSVAGLPAEVAIKLERATEVEFNQFMRFDPYLLEAVVSYNLQPYDIPMPRRMSGNILSSPNISVTQLQLATLFHRYALVTHLLSQKPGDVDDGVPTPLVVACAMRDGQRMADILLNHGASLKANDTSFQGRTPLHWAVESKNISMTRLLLERGADVDAVDRLRGRTPLHCATHDTSLSIVDVLLAKHADVHVSSTYSKETPLHLACGAGHVQLVNRLLEHGASIKAQDFLGRTPLHVAAAAGHNEVLDRLLRDIRAGRDSKDAYHTSLLEAKNSLGQTPLIAHIKTNGNVSTARILLLNGADPNTCDKDGDTALHAACAAQFCADIPALLLCLLHYGASVSATDNQGRTPLHRVAQSPWIALDLVEEARIEALISNGADPSAVDAQKCTPLHYAAKNELHLQVLLSRGASANARDTLGRTALHWIALGYGTDQCDATDVDARIKTLLEHGANLEITDDSGYTPGDLVFQEWCNVAEQVPRSAPAAAQVLRVFCLRGAVFISLAGREKRIRGRVRHTPGSGRGKPRSASCEFRSIPPMKEGNSGEERRCESCPPRRNCHPELDQPDEKMLDEAIERLHAYKPVKAELAV